MGSAVGTEMGRMNKLQLVLSMGQHEFIKATRAHPEPENSWHGAYGILEEEVDEVWDLVKAVKYDNITPEQYVELAKELKQVIHSAARFMVDQIPDEYVVEAAKDGMPWLDPELKSLLQTLGYATHGARAARSKQPAAAGSS